MLNKKTLTNLYDAPQLRATLFEPVLPNAYNLGSADYKWNEIWANRVGRTTYPVETVVPTGIQGTAVPPATRTLNSGYEYYIQAVNSSNVRIYKYYGEQPYEIIPTVGSMYFGTGSGTTNHLYYRTSSIEWRRIGINQS